MTQPLYVPKPHEVAAKAAELGVDLSARGARARVAQAIAAEHAPKPPEARQTEPVPVLLSRTVTQTQIGQLVLDLHLIPNDPHNEENRDDTAADRPAGNGAAGAAAGARRGDAAEG